MSYEVIGLDDAEAWDAALLPHGPLGLDVYFTAGYHRSHCLEAPEEARLFRFRRDGNQFLYAFRLREIRKIGDAPVAGGFRDIESVYGFTGPLATTPDPSFLAEAWAAFETWALEQRVVAEFVRFNPLLENTRFAPPSMTCERVRDHVVLDAGVDPERTWRDVYSKKNRNMIRKAGREGLTVTFGELEGHVASFTRLYRETMDRNRAAAEYYFDSRHFQALSAGVSTRVCVARKGEQELALSLFLIGPDWMHYHLSACSVEGLRLAANNLILHSAALETHRLGLRFLHLGGGRTGSPDDPLLRFKAGFSPQRRPVMIGRRVHLREPYEEFCARRREQHPSVPTGFFLAYRYEDRRG